MVDGVSGVADKPPVAAQPTAGEPKPNGKVRRGAPDQKGSDFDFEALAEAVARVQEYSDMVSGRALSFAIDNQLKRSVITVWTQRPSRW